MIIVPVLLAEQCCASCGGSADIVLVAPGSPPQTAPGGILIRATCMACWPVLGGLPIRHGPRKIGVEWGVPPTTPPPESPVF